MNGMFEKATRMGIRFDSVKGNLTIEDVWNLPLLSKNGADLDNLAKGLARKLKENDIGSFVVQSKKEDELTQLKFDIVKYIIEVKLAENAKALDAKRAKEKKDRILEIIADKDDQDLMSKSREELLNLANSL